MNEKQLRYDRLYMDIALRVAEMSYATRAKVGCVIEKEGNIIGIGWNGMPAGMDNCCEHVKLSLDQKSSCTVTNPEVSHSEENALAKIARSTLSSDGATAYVTLEPCMHCAKLLYSCGIKRVVIENPYKDHAGSEFLKARGIEVQFTK